VEKASIVLLIDFKNEKTRTNKINVNSIGIKQIKTPIKINKVNRMENS
jgi:GTP cyclohydrolase FolE2